MKIDPTRIHCIYCFARNSIYYRDDGIAQHTLLCVSVACKGKSSISPYLFQPDCCSLTAKIAASTNPFLFMVTYKKIYVLLSKTYGIYRRFLRVINYTLQVTKSIVALLQSLNWNKFSIVAENSPRWQTVADSLEVTKLRKHAGICNM